MNQEISQLHQWVDDHREEITEGLRGALRIPSKKEPAAGPLAPYGQPVRDALDYTLGLCTKLGFPTVKDVDGHAGHAEFGEGTEMVAALGHLDVVPEGDRWTFEPYGAEIKDGYIYARGASDDKGPTYAALYAAKALMDCKLPISRRVRLIFGCDEESGFGCVKHYWEVAREERPVLAFTPDADFPMVYAEKGISNIILERKLDLGSGGLRIQTATGGLRSNMVPDHAEAKLAGTADEVSAAVAKLSAFWDKNVSFEANGDELVIKSNGKSAHGSTPQVGDNAVSRLCRVLAELDVAGDNDWLLWTAYSADPTGAAIGVAGRDEVAGPLTCNLGVFEIKNDTVRVTYNIRYPVTWTIDTLLNLHRPVAEQAGWTVAEYSDSKSLHVPLDQEPAKTLMRVYQEETGDTTTKPMTMGGGTYARATPNAIAYGAAFPGGTDGPAHEPDERISIENLIKATKIYAHALYELAK